MPEKERSVKVTNLVIAYFIDCYKQHTFRNVPVVKNALRRMPTVSNPDNFMGLVMESLMQLPPEQMTGKECTFTYMKLRLVAKQPKWGDVPVNSAMK
jgi:hypothetical protein